MLKRVRKRYTKAGAPPGTLIHTGERKLDKSRLTVMTYDDAGADQKDFDSLGAALALCGGPRNTWLNLDGVHDAGLIQQIGTYFNIHPLTQEDVLNTDQRPKIESYEHYEFMVFKMLRLDDLKKGIVTEQVSLILTDNVLISFQESVGDVFDPVRERLIKNRGRIRQSGIDYLAYALIDAIVDHYFLILEHIGMQMDQLEVDTLTDLEPETLPHIHDLKREIIFLHKQIWPLREVVSALGREDARFIRPETRIFLRDVHDHCIQVLDTIESFRDLLSGLQDLYLSMMSHKMNEVIKVLTIIATLFIPTTFIAGVYGMNFRYMPELESRWGYPIVWIIMIIMMAGMLIYFKRKKWF